MAIALKGKPVIKSFEINVPDEVLNDLSRRLRRTRWIHPVEDAGWSYGASIPYLQELLTYWQNNYKWRDEERKLNQFNHFKAKIEDYDFHFIHEKSTGGNPIPVLLLHGWPDSFYRFHKIIPMLTQPVSAGLYSSAAFDVVVPSLPGFGFTQCPREITQHQPLRHHAGLLFRLMTEVLGYDKFVIAGGDGGSPMAQVMAIDYPESVVSIYLTDLGWNNSDVDQALLSQNEKNYQEESRKIFMKQSAYAMLQTTKPQTLSYSLNDSPAGLASWILDRFYFWCDCNDDIEKSFSKDELLTNIMIYWVTQTISSSMRNYRMDIKSPSLSSRDYVNVPVGLGLFPKDVGGVPPREFAARTLNVQHWTEMPSGGHFTAWEEPRLMAEDLVAFFQQFDFSK
jgi:pimeloyl-ACP methyl ester carboxylesterase